jgi:hypothetical protein
MAYAFNPFTGKLDDVGAGGASLSPTELVLNITANYPQEFTSAYVDIPIALDTVLYDKYTTYDTTNYIYTIPVSGVYLITTGLVFNDAGIGEQGNVMLKNLTIPKNEALGFPAAMVDPIIRLVASAPFNASSGDQIQLTWMCTTTSSTLYIDQAYTYASIYKLP